MPTAFYREGKETVEEDQVVDPARTTPRRARESGPQGEGVDRDLGVLGVSSISPLRQASTKESGSLPLLAQVGDVSLRYCFDPQRHPEMPYHRHPPHSERRESRG